MNLFYDVRLAPRTLPPILFYFILFYFILFMIYDSGVRDLTSVEFRRQELRQRDVESAFIDD